MRLDTRIVFGSTMRLDTRVVFLRGSPGSTSSFSRLRTTVGVPAGLRRMGMVVPSVNIMVRRRGFRDSTCSSRKGQPRMTSAASRSTTTKGWRHLYPPRLTCRFTIPIVCSLCLDALAKLTTCRSRLTFASTSGGTQSARIRLGLSSVSATDRKLVQSFGLVLIDAYTL